MSRRVVIPLIAVSVLLLPSLALTQQATGRARRPGGMDREQMHKRMLANLKQRLGASNDEWKTLSPKVEKVTEARRDLGGPGERMGPPMMGADRHGGPGEEGMGGRGRPEGGERRERGDRPERPDRPEGARDRNGPPDREGEGEPPAESEVAKAQHALREAVDSDTASAEDVAAKLAAYRQARDKAREQLKTAQKDLQAAVTPKQEAILVSMNILD